MQNKPKIVLHHNSQKYQFSHLLRHFQIATKAVPELLQAADVLDILSQMRFLPLHLSEHDYELANTITHLLSFPRGQGTVTRRNLFMFLMTIT